MHPLFTNTRKKVKNRSAKVRNQTLAKYPLCARCHKDSNLHAHHIDPIGDGGYDDLENCITLCGGCHMEWHVCWEQNARGHIEKSFFYWLKNVTPYNHNISDEDWVALKKERLTQHLNRVLTLYS